MFCPLCQREQPKKMWRPCQWKLSTAHAHVYEGCRACDGLSEADQQYIADGLEWRFWYLQRDWAMLEAMVQEVRISPFGFRA